MLPIFLFCFLCIVLCIYTVTLLIGLPFACWYIVSNRLIVNGLDGCSYLELRGVNTRPHLPMLAQ